MRATRPAALAVFLPLALLLGPCAAENALITSFTGLMSELIQQKQPPASPRSEPLKVFSAGMSRTGTMSLGAALSELGYNTFHGTHMGMRQIQALGDAYMTGDSSNFLDELARNGFNASVEFMYFPVVTDALARYPDARVILCVRDSTEKWVDSYLEVLRASIHMAFGPIAALGTWLGTSEKFFRLWCGQWVWLLNPRSTSPAAVMQECGNLEAVEKSRWYQFMFHGLWSPEYRVHLAEIYENMNAEVRKAVPQEQLLEFSVKQGYGPLCRFLGVPEDECPASFPHINGAGEMKNAGRIFAAIRYGWWVPVFLPFLCCLRPRKTREAKKND